MVASLLSNLFFSMQIVILLDIFLPLATRKILHSLDENNRNCALRAIFELANSQNFYWKTEVLCLAKLPSRIGAEKGRLYPIKKHEPTWKPSSLEFRHISRPKPFYLGLPNSILKSMCSNACGLHMTKFGNFLIYVKT